MPLGRLEVDGIRSSPTSCPARRACAPERWPGAVVSGVDALPVFGRFVQQELSESRSHLSFISFYQILLSQLKSRNGGDVTRAGLLTHCLASHVRA
jgi:hypothetical protein